MLVKRACETDGEVKDCPEVIEASNKYRQGQDCITGFIMDKLVAADNQFGITQTNLSNIFKEWNAMYFANRKAPKLSELIEAITKKFGNKNPKTNRWHNFKIKDDNDNDFDNNDD